MSALRTACLLGCLCLVLVSGSACRSRSSKEITRARPNVVLISIDTLRADHLGAYGYPRSTSPFLDSVAREGQLFTSVVVPLPATNPSHASLFTSLHPLQHGVLENWMALPADVETLAEVLQKAGYFTMGVVANTHIGHAYNYDQGFDLFSEDPLVPVPNEHQRFGDDVSNAAIDFLGAYARQRRGQSFFLFVHYFDAHTPYRRHESFEPPEPVPQEGLPTTGRSRILRLTQRYDSEIRFVDEQMRRLFAELERLGLTDNLLTCITADHGEQLGEHGYSAGHFDLYRETVRVPLIFRGAGIAKGTVARTTSSMDIPVSILARLGLRFSNSVVGRDAIAGSGRGGREAWAGHTDRPLLVIGYPNYTRSLAVVRDDLWYIRNLDFQYRYLFTGDAVTSSARPPKGMREATLLTSDKDSLYVTPMDGLSGRIRPVYVAAEIHLSRPGCAADLTLAVAPNLMYLPRPMRLKRSTRILYPASSRDVTSLLLSPGECVAGVYYSVHELEDVERRHGIEPGPNAVETRAWSQLKTARKEGSRNELYDLASDPTMIDNRIDAPTLQAKAKELDGAVDRLWVEHSREGHRRQIVRPSISHEEAESLRALGYLE